MTAPKKVSKAELHAFVDGQLDAERHREVAEHIPNNPDDAARVAAYEMQNRALQAIFNPVLDEELPHGLTPRRRTPRRIHLLWAAASIVLFVAGGLIGWQAQQIVGTSIEPDFAVARGAAVAHKIFTPQRRHPVEVTADEEAHLVRWLSKVLKAPLRAPRLGDLGFSLVGGRLLSAEKGPAAQFMYEDAKRRRITLYVITDGDWRGQAEFQYTQQGPVGVFYWISGRVGYGLTAEMPRTELLKIVSEIGSEEGYLLILEKQYSAILYAPDAIDLTEEVIKRYDASRSQ